MTHYYLARVRSTKENAVRGRAKRLGYTVCKSRGRTRHHNDRGGFQLLITNQNTVVLGDQFDASLEDIADYMTAAIHMSELQPEGSA